MAVLSDYTSGTISLANGSTTVTGTGTLFEVTRFREGDTLQIQNLTAVIASVDSDTQLTLTEPWTGTSIVDGPYRARQLADGTRVGTQAATLIELLGDGTLAGLAALGVEEGKAPVGGPAGQYVLEPVATDPNGSLGKLAALTLAARQILQTDAAGALKQVALAANKLLATDANADLTLTDALNDVSIDTGKILKGILEHARSYFRIGSYDEGLYGIGNAQIHYRANTRELRIEAAGAGSGAVNLTIGGVSIVTLINNANGMCTRLVDGTQICSTFVTLNANGDADWTFPAAFSRVPNVIACIAGTTTNALSTAITGRTTTNAGLRGRYSSTNSPVSATVYVQAHGMWL